ncbi:unnamed protein product [Prunus armeniaca]|uniref:Uncharacterized protein n=1 Tax=Prunus armeniaca TaxID=36596 RepID=A0A6J5WK35_PRUAR|nr:unnamed protein product [Prunus armeniaca]
MEKFTAGWNEGSEGWWVVTKENVKPVRSGYSVDGEGCNRGLSMRGCAGSRLSRGGRWVWGLVRGTGMLASNSKSNRGEGCRVWGTAYNESNMDVRAGVALVWLNSCLGGVVVPRQGGSGRGNCILRKVGLCGYS